jgi:hypothetical protein
MIRLALFAVVVLFAELASAQNPQPYAGFEQRPVKALSDQQVTDLRAGRGMGFALAAELNGYPGPAHVLEHSDVLQLTGEQARRTRELFEAMQAEAISIGERLIAQETELDRAFAEKTITAPKLAETLAEIGATQGALRATHLRYHLSQAALLTPHQLRRYAELRGYVGGAGGGGHGGHVHPGGGRHAR